MSLLLLLSKVFEKVVLDQTEEFLSLNKALYDYQSGFRKKNSTDTCLFFNDKILKGSDDGLLTGMILTDLKKVIRLNMVFLITLLNGFNLIYQIVCSL